MNAPRPPGQGFVRAGDVYERPTTFPRSLEATMGLDGPVIAIGTPADAQAKTSTRWVVTLMHEHFHALQQSQPGLYEKELALGLAHGDSTGMWMLNYPFPYTDATVGGAFAKLQSALAAAVEARGTPAMNARIDAYLQSRAAFARTLRPDDYAYFAFQLWAEGVARYTEYRVALAADRFAPVPAYANLRDATPFLVDAQNTLAGITRELRALSLAKDQRVCFYAIGAAEGLLLDERSPAWRGRYFSEPFDTGKYFAAN